MKTETFIEEMQRVGKCDHPPQINVVSQVMQKIQTPPCNKAPQELNCLTWTAAVSTGIALVLGILAMQLSSTTVDPLVQLVFSLPWGMI
jgi:hypothetical protein